MRKRILIKICILLIIIPFYSQTIQLCYKGENNKYELVERSDLRKYVNGKYVGLKNKEVRSFVTPIPPPANYPTKIKNNSWFSGSFLVIENVQKDKQSAEFVNETKKSLFYISPEGKLEVIPDIKLKRLDTGFPEYRSFPSFPIEKVAIGSTWVAKSIRSIDPFNSGVYTKLQNTVQYTFKGEELYKGKKVFRIESEWATRYGSGTVYHDYDGDENLVKATGKHQATILVSVDNGGIVLIRDLLDETFTYNDGNEIRYAGTTLLFTDYVPSLDRTKILPPVNRVATLSQDNKEKYTQKKPVEKVLPSTKPKEIIEDFPENIVTEETDVGIRFSIRDIRFVPDSSDILPEEAWRLDQIASILSKVASNQFLVEGHSASTGNPKGEEKLSIERAKKIVKELVKRGIAEKQFLYTGYGSTRPIGDNNTVEGKTQNRRVEITILGS